MGFSYFNPNPAGQKVGGLHRPGYRKGDGEKLG